MRAIGLAAPLAAIGLWALVPGTSGSLSATIHNNLSSAGTTASLLTATDTSSSSSDCSSSVSPISATQSLSCSRSTLPATLAASGTSSQSITLASSGGASPTRASFTATACGPVALSDQTVSTDPMLVRGGVSYAGSGPLSGSASLGLDGSSASAEDIVSTSSTTLGTSFTEGIWFKVANGYTGGGTLIGFGSSPSTVSDTSADKILSMTTAGKLNFAVSGTLGTLNVTSSGAYNDGNWHFAAVTVSTSTLSTVTMYVDGSQAATSTNLSLLGGYAGYWHVGWSPVSSGSAYLAGNLANAFVVDGTALSSTRIATLAGSGTQSAWNSDLSTDGASESWGLGDAGTATYSGTLPLIGTTSPCTMVSLAIGASGFCIYSPNSTTTGCSTPTGSSSTLSNLVAAGSQSFPATTIGSPVTLTTTLIRASSYNTTFMPGLRLYLPVTLTEALGASSPWYTTLNWTGTSQQVQA